MAWVYLIVAMCIVFHANLIRSRHGRALLAVRDDEVAAESVGVPTTRYKVEAFVIGAAFAGLAGGLRALRRQLRAVLAGAPGDRRRRR